MINCFVESLKLFECNWFFLLLSFMHRLDEERRIRAANYCVKSFQNAKYKITVYYLAWVLVCEYEIGQVLGFCLCVKAQKKRAPPFKYRFIRKPFNLNACALLFFRCRCNCCWCCALILDKETLHLMIFENGTHLNFCKLTKWILAAITLTLSIYSGGQNEIGQSDVFTLFTRTRACKPKINVCEWNGMDSYHFGSIENFDLGVL